MPQLILHDTRLSAYARLVYAELALWVFQARTCSVGTRQIAARLGFSKTTVTESIQQLVAAGVVTLSKSGAGKRTVYVLNSPVFGQKQGKATTVVSSPRGDRRYASVDIEEVA